MPVRAGARLRSVEYLMLRHGDGNLRTNLRESRRKMSYQVPCHLRVQNVGLKSATICSARARNAPLKSSTLLGPQRHLRGEEEVPGVPLKIGAAGRRVDHAGQGDIFTSDRPMAATRLRAGFAG